ncbi:transketolase [Clostridium thailandense]|uniref:Transketolase n=1 Tax=Clostridium thailandense TaxID=2794346 RepID=A0A949TFU6_9CLOT|nr:transketolase [Clostridium thailandense]MBV7272019.1 transketolase [Clostridium thailandense]MCH5137417.1 transketolase [Clostridiaceae bacterium UIB06]
MDKSKEKELAIIATKVRKHIVEQVYRAKSGHPGGSLSIADVLTVLYFNNINIDVNNSKWEDRDRFVLSKGHCSPALYSVLAERGFFSVEDLKGFRSIDSVLQGHPDMKYIKGVDMSSGSLGQGLSAANGMALSAKIHNKNYRVYAALGDGEIAEGQIWEAAMFAAHYKLDNVTAFVDVNGLQIDGPTCEVMNSEPIDKKFEAFGWNVIKIDGHNYNQIESAIIKAKETKEKPTAVICKTTKGKGVSFMENQAKWHGSAPNEEQYNQAIKELDELISVLEVL